MPNPTKRSRPHMSDYGIQTGEQGMLNWEWVVQQIDQSRNYWVCTTRRDGRPHVAPVWGVWIEGVLYFGSSRKSIKAYNLARNPALVINLESGDEVVIIEGTAEEVTDRAIHAKIAATYPKKYPGYSPEIDPQANEIRYLVKPQMVLAWLEKDFPTTATRWEFSGK